MYQREIIRNGKLYTLICLFAKSERTTPARMYRLIERGLPTVVHEGHVYISREDYCDFCGYSPPNDKPENAVIANMNAITLGNRTYHPIKWYMAQHPVSRKELMSMPHVMVSGLRCIAEDDFKERYWWMEG